MISWLISSSKIRIGSGDNQSLKESEFPILQVTGEGNLTNHHLLNIVCVWETIS